MVLSKKFKFIFLANPRTASTSVQTPLRQYNEFYKREQLDMNMLSSYAVDLNHIGQDVIRKIIESKGDTIDFSDYYEFVFVRNPYTRLLSFYKYMKHSHPKQHPTIPTPEDEYAKKNNLTFKGFLDKVEGVLNGVIKNDARIYSQMSYVKNPLTANINIFKFENLADDFEKVKTDLGLDLGVLQHANFIPPAISLDQLLPQYKERIYSMFREEFETFGYSK